MKNTLFANNILSALLISVLLFSPFLGYANTKISKTASTSKTYITQKVKKTRVESTIKAVRNQISKKISFSKKDPVSNTVIHRISSEDLGFISVWMGKVNMHKFPGGEWQTDSDHSSGAAVDKLEYCRKFWPATNSFEERGLESISGWQDAGGVGSYTNTKMTYACMTGLAHAYADGINNASVPANNNEYKVLVVLADYLDSENSDNFTQSQAEGWFNGYPLRDFFYEQSYGKLDISADVYGWYTSPLNGEGSGCNPVSQNNSGNFSPLTNPGLINYLNQNNISFADYDHMVVLVDCKNQTWGGYANNISLNGNEIPVAVVVGVSDQPSLHFTAHEMGHKIYDMHTGHANSLDCETTDYNAENCSVIGYGNPYDAMGSWQAYSHHFRAQLKDDLGWLNSDQITEVTQSGVYTINPLETVGGVKMVKINPSYTPGMTHYVEFRNGHGFDSNLLNDPNLISNTQGLFVYKKSKGSADAYNLVDVTPTSQSWDQDIKNTTLNQGMVFNDPIWGVKIETLTVNSNQITFRVTLNSNSYVQCVGPNVGSDFELDPSYLPSQNPQSGESARHTLSVEIFLDNPAPTCLNQVYTNTLVDDAGLNVDIQTSEKIVYLEGRRKWYGSIGIPEGLPEGAYDIKFEFTNEETGQITPATYRYYTPDYDFLIHEYTEASVSPF